MNQFRTPDKRRFAQEVEARFGLMPNFFCTATDAPGLVDELWAFAKSAYLDSPLPSLFKERLFVFLSRFCAVRYCVVRHVGFLIGEGRPAGDVSAPPETIEQVIALLTRPARGARALEQALARLEALTGPVDIPAPRTELESDLFDALTIIFLEPRLSERARNAVRRAFGGEKFEILIAYLAFIRTAHYWTEAHPELGYEPDIAAVMQQHPDLAALLLDPTEASLVAEGEALRQAMAQLAQAKQACGETEKLLAILLKLSDALRPLGDALEIQRVACRVLREHLVATRVTYAEAFGHEDLHETASDAEANAQLAPIRYRIADFGAEAALQLHAGKPRWCDDVLADLRLAEAEKSAASAIGVRAFANLPLVKDGNLVAMLGVHWNHTHAWSARELELLREVAERTWAAAERARAEAALRGSEERLRLAQLQTGVGIWDRNLRTGKLTWTPELEALFGLQPGTVKCYAEFRDRVHSDDIEAFEAKRDAAVRDRKTFNVELRIIRADGQIRWMSVTGGAVYDETAGEPVRFLGNFVDITERKVAKEKLRKGEQAFRELLGALPAAIFVTDAGGRITYYNQAAVELWGKRPELGKDRWSDLARPYSADGKLAKLRDCPTEIALRQGKSIRGLAAMLERADGTRIPVLPYPTPIRDDTGTIVGVVNMTVDISERRQAERTLAERNAQLAIAGRAALVGSYVYDVNKGTTQISEGYAAIHGLPEGTTDTTISEWRARVHPEDLARAEGLREQAFSLRRKEDNADYRIILSTGEIRWIERRGAISYGEDGRPERVVGVNIDITERKCAEERQCALVAELKQTNNRLQLALDCAELGTWSLHLDTGRFENDVRDRCIHGHGQEAPSKTLAEMRSQVHPDDLSKLDTAFAELGHAGGSCRTEYRLAPCTVQERTGGVRWVTVEGTVLRRANGCSEQLLGVTRDITERKKAEAVVRESEMRLAGQLKALELALNGAPLKRSLGVLVRTATDQLGEGVRAAFYLANPAHTGLHHVVGMPAAYAEAVDGFEIGPASLSCGLATHTGLPILTPDVAKEPRWTPWRWLAEMFDFRGCWSFPIRTEAGRFVGTFAIYWRQPREATPRELELATVLTATAAIIIARYTDAEQRDRARDALRESEARLNAVIEGAADGILTIDEGGIVRSLNTAAMKMFGYATEEVIGHNFSMLVPEPYRSAYDGYLKRYRETGEGGIIGTRREVEGRRKDEQTFPMDLAVAEVPTSGQRLFVGIVRDVTERKRAEERQRTLVAELDHRVKNALATVSAVVSHTRPRSRSVPDFAAALEGRLRSMAATHELLSAHWWQGVSLTELIRRELAPYAAHNNTELSGPAIMLRAEAGQAMAMVLHELATNAAKHGALSTMKGRVSIRWDRPRNGPPPRLALEWQEMGGPPVIAPVDPSYGTSTIRDLIPYEFDGTVDLVFAPEGVQCRIELPGNWLSYDGEPISQPASEAHCELDEAEFESKRPV